MLMLSVCLSCYCALAEESPEQSAQLAAETWLRQVDAGEYAASWQAASAYFQGAVTEKALAAALQGVREPLGKVVSRKLQRAQYTTSLPGAPDGHYVVMQFDTRFEHKQSAVETVTFMQEKDGRWKAAGYYIR
jgi:uncharacterized protein DUF4019